MKIRSKEEALWEVLKGMAWGLAVCWLLSLLVGCKTKVVTVPEVHTSYIHSTDTAHVYHRDSIYRKDSVFTTVYAAGDTVYKVAHFYHYDTQWKDRVAYQSRSDTVLRTDTVTVVRPVEAELSKAQRRYATIGKWACGVGLATVVGLVVTLIWWYRRKT